MTFPAPDTTARALSVGAGRFYYAENAIQELPGECARLGDRPYILGSPGSIDRATTWLSTLPSPVGVAADPGHCTRTAADRHARHAAQAGATVIIGTGGGKALDLAKATATLAHLPVITIPTSLATCAASAAVCIMYDDHGHPDGAITMPHEVDAVIADQQILSAAPRRLIISGMLDSLAKLPELQHATEPSPTPPISATKTAASALAASIHEFYTENWPRLLERTISPQLVEQATVTNVLLTSMVSGLSAGLGQLALAHALYDFTRERFTSESLQLLHGETVGIGIALQLAFNGHNPAGVRATLEALGIQPVLRTITPAFDAEHIDAFICYCITAGVISEHEAPRLRTSLDTAALTDT